MSSGSEYIAKWRDLSYLPEFWCEYELSSPIIQSYLAAAIDHGTACSAKADSLVT